MPGLPCPPGKTGPPSRSGHLQPGKGRSPIFSNPLQRPRGQRPLPSCSTPLHRAKRGLSTPDRRGRQESLCRNARRQDPCFTRHLEGMAAVCHVATFHRDIFLLCQDMPLARRHCKKATVARRAGEVWRVKALREDTVHTHRYPAALSGRQAFPHRALRPDVRFL